MIRLAMFLAEGSVTRTYAGALGHFGRGVSYTGAGGSSTTVNETRDVPERTARGRPSGDLLSFSSILPHPHQNISPPGHNSSYFSPDSIVSSQLSGMPAKNHVLSPGFSSNRPWVFREIRGSVESRARHGSDGRFTLSSWLSALCRRSTKPPEPQTSTVADQ
jgi:hypothetical protein